ncbi:MAG: DnaJ domain-containing protein [Thermodesulfobacteriota bacterium]|nr:DnaJ domain-containing protein [Thermodesulfobacteriota bacterium]
MMKTPFEILQIDENTADPAIKKAYLAGVKKYPPERFPSEFQKIRAAYEAIKTAEDRTAFKLFHKELPDKQELIEMALAASGGPDHPDPKLIKKVLAENIKGIKLPVE